VSTHAFRGARMFTIDEDWRYITKPSGHALQVLEAGWPMYALAGERIFECQARSGNIISTRVEWGIASEPQARVVSNRACLFPLRPVWPGFVVNAVLYAAILYLCWTLLMLLPLTLRRRRRLRCGLCPKCGYDLRQRPSDSSVCPECGATVTAQWPNPA
jgi:hypothetical protein